ncbi:MAG: ATP-binding protein [Xenococcaceae cyanobacterium]
MKFWRKHLTARLASYFLFLSLVTVGIVGGVAFLRARNSLKQSAFNRLSVAATLKDEEISRWFEYQQRDFLLITQFPDVQAQLKFLLTHPASAPDYQAAYAVLSKYLEGITEIKPNLQEISVLNISSRVILSTDKIREGKYSPPVNFTYFERIDPEDPVIPIFHVSPITGKLSVTFATPVQDQVGNPIGIISVQLNLERVDQIIRERSGLGETGESYLVGSLVTGNAFISKAQSETEQELENVSSPGIESALLGVSGSGLYRNYAGVPVVGVYRWLNDRDIALLVEMEQAEAFAPARQLAVTILLVGLGAAGLLSMGVYWLSRQITRPILAIADTATQVAVGDLERAAPVLTEDEVGILARNFNQMAKQLKESFAALETKNAELKHLDQLKNEFLANTSHELRTPVNGMIGIAESMIEGATGEISQVQRKNLLMIAQSGHRLANLVNDILDFSKLRHKDIELQLKPIGLREIAEVVLRLNQTLVGNKDLQLINAIPDDLPPAEADENRLQQILHNLVGNAIKFTASGTVEISAELGTGENSHPTPHNTQSSMLAITVSDTGIGIREDKLDRIFESFEQAEGSTAREYGGSGLGLAVTKKLVELHGGEIRLESTPDVGSQFTFTLPISERPLESQPTQSSLVSRQSLAKASWETIPYNSHWSEVSSNGQPTSPPSPATTSSPPKPGEWHILIVDDEPVNRQVLVNYLSLHHYAITQASGGPEALALLEGGLKPDLILLDVMMPRMTGYEVTQKIRSSWQLDELPIVLLTAKNLIPDLVAGLEAGSNDYLTKPIAKEELLARLKTHLNLRQLRAENLRQNADLQRAKDKLAEYNRTLEEKVSERTQELSQTLQKLKDTQAQIIAQEKLASLGALTAGIAHEIKNPLNFVNNFAELSAELTEELLQEIETQKDRLDSENREYIEEILNDLNQNAKKIKEHGKRADKIVHGMLMHSRGQPGERQLRDINVLLAESINLAYHGIRAQDPSFNITIETNYDDSLEKLNVVSQDISRVFLNVINNACYAAHEKKMRSQGMPGNEGEEFAPTLSVSTKDLGERVEIRIRDNGKGIPQEVRDKIFHPFFTTKPTGKGTGLGLSISHDIVVQEHQGELRVETEVDSYTEFIIILPKTVTENRGR